MVAVDVEFAMTGSEFCKNHSGSNVGYDAEAQG